MYTEYTIMCHLMGQWEILANAICVSKKHLQNTLDSPVGGLGDVWFVGLPYLWVLGLLDESPI